MLADKIFSIESALGTTLKPSDLTPTFHIATNSNRKPLGTVLFLDIDSPQGKLKGGIGLDMHGKVVRVEILENAGAMGIMNREFLDQFTGMGIENVFQVGEDVKPIAGQEEISQSIARLPQKALLNCHPSNRMRLLLPPCQWYPYSEYRIKFTIY